MSYVRFAKKSGLVALAVAMLSLGIMGSAPTQALAQDQAVLEQTADTPDTVEPVAPAVPLAQPAVEVSGKGQMVSKKFPLQAGLVTFHATHGGSSNFVVYILDGTTGAEVTSIVNEIGKVDATKAVQLRKSGTYAVQVQADGEWALTFEQPRPTEAPNGPQAYSGTGTSISPFFHSTGGLLVIGGTYQGNGRVAIRLRDANGVVVEQIANQVGSFTGSKGVRVTPGIYFLELYGNGDWSVNVE